MPCPDHGDSDLLLIRISVIVLGISARIDELIEETHGHTRQTVRGNHKNSGCKTNVHGIKKLAYPQKKAASEKVSKDQSDIKADSRIAPYMIVNEKNSAKKEQSDTKQKKFKQHLLHCQIAADAHKG